MAFSTITIDGSTVVAPSEIQAYAESAISKLIPIDGNVILQTSNNRDSYGDKNFPRVMSWEAITTTGAGWTHTLGTLVALEGTDVVLNASNCGGYTTTQNIRVHEVKPSWIGNNGTTDIWSLTITFSHR